MNYVLDASILASHLLGQPPGAAWEKLVRYGIRPAMPDWAQLETANALWKLSRASRISNASELLRLARRLAVDWHPVEPHVPRALELGLELGCTAYDGIYIALALSLDAILITADKRLVRLSKPLHRILSWEAVEL